MTDWIGQLLTTALGSGAAFAVIQTVTTYRREHREQKNAKQFLALQLAFLFEGYAIECASKASDHQTAVENEGHAGTYLSGIPPFPNYPESTNYKLLSPNILEDVYDFPQRRQMADLNALFWWETVGDRDSYQVAIGENTIKIGKRALEIAQKIRNSYGLGFRSLTFEKWDIDEYFEKELEQIEKRKTQEETQTPNIDLS